MSGRTWADSVRQGGQGGGDGGGQGRRGGSNFNQSRGGGGGFHQSRGGGGGFHQSRGGGGGFHQSRGGGGGFHQSRGGGGGGGFHQSRGGGGGGGFHQSRGGGGGGYSEQPPVKLECVKAVDNIKRQFVGSLGKQIRLIVNYFSMNYDVKRQLIGYHVDISCLDHKNSKREIKNRMSLRNLFWNFVKANEEFFGPPFNHLFDDRHQIYSWKALKLECNKPKEFTLENTDSNGKKSTIVMEIKKTKSHAVDFNILNLLITQYARCPAENFSNRVYCDIDRIFFRPCNDYVPLDLNYALQMLKGIQATVKKGPNGIALANFDVTYSGFYKANVDILAFYAFVKTGREMGENDLKKLQKYSLSYDQRRELRSVLNGLILRTKCGVIGNYRFTDVSEKTPKTMRFKQQVFDKNGKLLCEDEVTVQQYYEKKYGRKLLFPDMPLIQCGPRDKNLMFPIEVLMLHDNIQRLRAKLPDVLIAKTQRFTTKEPLHRFGDIMRMIGDLSVCTSDPFLKAGGVDVNPKMLEIEGRVLPAPDCLFNKPFGVLMKAQAVAPPQRSVVFLLIVVNRSINIGDLEKRAFNMLVTDCEKRGMRFAQTNPLLIREFAFNKSQLGDLIHECHRSSLAAHPTAIPMLIFVVPFQDSQIYDNVKTECEINVGVLSQVLLSQTFRKMADRPELQNSVTRNIFLKLNAKMGGVNNRIVGAGPAQANWAKFTDPKKPTLFIGIDVTHQAPGDTDFPSIASAVGNLDVQATKYAASVRVQMVRTEEIIDMEMLCRERIEDFVKINKVYPAHILIFRDGVSESQFDCVVDLELQAMRRACSKIRQGYAPNFTVVVVQKRHSTRFYAPDASVPGVNKGNVPPGTVVDRYITDENKVFKEFYLCSHKGMLGTSRPIHCYVIFDDWGLSADDLESCTYNLCHLFARAPMSVSLPAPVFYAHLCCYRARRHFMAQRYDRDRPSDQQRMVTICESIRNNMYFC